MSHQHPRYVSAWQEGKELEMFVRGERVATLRPPKATAAASGRPRYCVRCGGPLGLSAFATSGVRCLGCGAQPGIGVQTQSHSEPRDFALPRRYATIPIVPVAAPEPPLLSELDRPLSIVPRAVAGPGSVTGLSRRVPTAPRVAPKQPAVTSVYWSAPPATMELARVGAWMRDLSRPSARFMITAVAAGIAVLAALTVSMTLG